MGCIELMELEKQSIENELKRLALDPVDFEKDKEYKILHLQSTNTLNAKYVGKEAWNHEFIYIFRYTLDDEEFFPHWFLDEFEVLN